MTPDRHLDALGLQEQAATGRPVQQERVAVAGVQERDDDRVAVPDERDVRDQAGVEDRVQLLALGALPLRHAPDARLVVDREGLRHGPEGRAFSPTDRSTVRSAGAGVPTGSWRRRSRVPQAPQNGSSCARW